MQAVLRVLKLRRRRVRHRHGHPRVVVLQRSHSARLAASIIAPVLLVSALITAGFAAALVTAAIAMLWVQPTRSWFDGVEPPKPYVRPGRGPEARSGSGAEAPLAERGSASALPPPRSGTALPPPSGPPSAWGLPAPRPTAGPGGPVDSGLRPMSRPRQVTTACTLTIVSSTVALGALAISLLFLTTSRATLVDEIDKELATTSYDTLTAETLADVMVVFFAVLVVWAVVAIGLAIATLRGSNVARICLVVSSFAAAVVSLVGVLVVVPLLFTAAGIVSAVLLLGPDAKAWFAGR